jgi:cysteine desulfurase/selenocysteine lyase
MGHRDAPLMYESRYAGRLDINRREFGRGALLGWLAAMGLPQRLRAEVSTTRDSLDSKAERWRTDFPVLNQRVGDHPLTYLDSAATTQRPVPVLEAMMDFYRHDNANPGSALHALARRAYERYEGARRTFAIFLNATQPEEVVCVRGSTEGINLVAAAWGRSTLRPSDEILLTLAEHASNLLPWRLLADQTRATVRYVDVDDDGRVLLEDLDRSFRSVRGS